MRVTVGWSSFSRPAHGLSDDFEVALKGLASQTILFELLQGDAVGNRLDKVRSFADVFKQLGSA